MSQKLEPPTATWRVLNLLWKSARLRAKGRIKYQRALRRKKTGSESNAIGGLLGLFTIVFCCLVHGFLGSLLAGSIKTSQSINWEKQGKLVVPQYLDNQLLQLRDAEKTLADPDQQKQHHQAQVKWDSAAKSIANSLDYLRSSEFGGTTREQRDFVMAHCLNYGSSGFIVQQAVSLTAPSTLPPSFWLLASLVIGWWMLMMICQGEGLEMDIQRRRHPLWEWLFSHPVRPAAAFSAEMLAPMMANPIYLSAPVFWFLILKTAYSFSAACLGAMTIGIPFAIAASCLNKSIEISAMLRLPVRKRGVILGIVSWFGYIGMLLPLFLIQIPELKAQLLQILTPLEHWQWLWLPSRMFVTGWQDQAILWQAVATSSGAAVLLLFIALTITKWATRNGLQGNESTSGPVSKRSVKRSQSPVRDPYYRKELLWLWRDKGAVVQAVLIPLSLAAFQAINLRGLSGVDTMTWNLFCGFGVICGTYFLLVLGPRSLVSEGGALWIALTWPQGLETLLKTKAKLWWTFSTVIVGAVLIAAVVRFPQDWWRILLVAIGWFFFSWGLSLKAVTLVTAPSSSGEAEPPAPGRKWAAMIGTLAFGAGVMANSWHVATIGVVFAALTSAAMWQNLRARLPYLFDRWSEKLPPAPTLMHSMIAIAVTVEVVGVTTAVASAMGTSENLWLARTIAYGLVGSIAWAVMHCFLVGRGVNAGEIWFWAKNENPASAWKVLSAALVSGATLGGLACLYIRLLKWLPQTSDYMAKLVQIQADFADGIVWQIALAVGLAPFAEEYLFRGLLFRALDREWGGWKALAGSAAFFAVYHPPVSWIPVFCLGILTAWTFKKTDRLWASVIIHMIYNLIVILSQS